MEIRNRNLSTLFPPCRVLLTVSIWPLPCQVYVFFFLYSSLITDFYLNVLFHFNLCLLVYMIFIVFHPDKLKSELLVQLQKSDLKNKCNCFIIPTGVIFSVKPGNSWVLSDPVQRSHVGKFITRHSWPFSAPCGSTWITEWPLLLGETLSQVVWCILLIKKILFFLECLTNIIRRK